ncbi:helix-turn-helix domain-containing protein [Streptomyces sp. NPDC086549]|uniref:helix-turn-helix domain-containing protein n=1 Tax=Streptomyces sp. NPDC086549 TaxID=3365752 RepID=UPI00380E00DE
MTTAIPQEVKADTVLRVLRGKARARAAARTLGVPEACVESWIQCYVHAGCRRLSGSTAVSPGSERALAQVQQLRSALDEALEDLAVLNEVLSLAARV